MYSRSITRNNRALIIIAIDQSCSMAGEVKSMGRTFTKADMLSEVVNDLISELVERSRRSDGVRDYYDIAIVGYSGEGVTPLLGAGDTPWRSIVDIASLSVDEVTLEREYILPNGEHRFLSHRCRCWIRPKAVGSTPMYEALLSSHEIAEMWCAKSENRESFPLMIFNVTDGESTDCDYSDIAEIASRIKAISTHDGAALLINVHIASDSAARSMLFPSLAEMAVGGESSLAALSLFHSSSELPPIFMDAVSQIKGSEQGVALKAMSYNCSISELITILNIGSISVKRG
ncbi:MAG: VWA domain-containing protein [Rikenellaceae bacterium]